MKKTLVPITTALVKTIALQFITESTALLFLFTVFILKLNFDKLTT